MALGVNNLLARGICIVLLNLPMVAAIYKPLWRDNVTVQVASVVAMCANFFTCVERLEN